MTEGYQVIARRWRPRQFDELVGQDHIVRTLKNAISSGRTAHAYLFVGPRGTGKTSTARIFAKALNAEGGPSVSPSDDSELSQAIMSGSCMDVIEIDGASNNSVDEVRGLRENCQYAPAQATYKIYIIDEVHMLSAAAFNALLKTLEEPPPHVKFIFATTEAQKVLATIVSRCQRFEFRPISEALIAERLGEIAKAESIRIDEEALGAIARLANGGMRDAQSILDQMISFCGNDLSVANVLEVYGLASRDQIEAIAAAIAAADYEKIVASVEEMANDGLDLYRVLVDLQTVVREALLDAIRKGGSSARLGQSLSTEVLLRLLETLHAGEHSVKTGLSEKVNFEVVLLQAVDRSRTRSIDTVIRQITDLAAGLPEEADQKKKLTSEPAPAEAASPSSPETSAVSVADDSPSPAAPPLGDSASDHASQSQETAPPEPSPGHTELAVNESSAGFSGDEPPLPEPPPDLVEPPPAHAPVEETRQSTAPAIVDAKAQAQRLPETARSLLQEYFRAEVTEVRRADKEEWL